MSRAIKTLILSTALVLAGCATVMSGTTQTIQIQAIDATTQQPLSGVTCSIMDGKGNVYTPNGVPGAFIVSVGNGALQPNCRKAGYRQASVGVGSSFNGWTIVNILFWPGLLVDAATGAIEKYPSHITVLMNRT